LGALDDVVVTSPLYLFVEAGSEDAVPGPYGLQVALNHVTGYAACPVERELRAGAFEGAPVQVDAAGARFREVQIEGTTSLAGDRFYLPCAAGGAAPDGFGGAPDHVVALVADVADGRPRRADVTLDTGDAWDGVLVVTGAPCGAASQEIACANPPGPATVSDLLLMPGVPVYLVVDGRGDDVADGRASGPYRLRVRLYEP
jgi:hypothetical protein